MFVPYKFTREDNTLHFAVFINPKFNMPCYGMPLNILSDTRDYTDEFTTYPNSRYTSIYLLGELKQLKLHNSVKLRLKGAQVAFTTASLQSACLEQYGLMDRRIISPQQYEVTVYGMRSIAEENMLTIIAEHKPAPTENNPFRYLCEPFKDGMYAVLSDAGVITLMTVEQIKQYKEKGYCLSNAYIYKDNIYGDVTQRVTIERNADNITSTTHDLTAVWRTYAESPEAYTRYKALVDNKFVGNDPVFFLPTRVTTFTPASYAYIRDKCAVLVITKEETLLAGVLNAGRLNLLNTVVGWSNITTFGACCLQGCNNLKELYHASKHALSIGDGAFAKASFNRVVIDTDLHIVKENAFKESRISTLHFNGKDAASWLIAGKCAEDGTPREQWHGGSAFSSTSLAHMPLLRELKLPDNMVVFTTALLLGNTFLRRLPMPSGLTCISADALRDCGDLANIKIPNSVQIIGDNAFNRANGVTSLCLNGVALHERAFAYVGKLQSIELSNMQVPEGCFVRCANLQSVRLHNVCRLNEGAFTRCTHLETVWLVNDKDITINADCFANCTNLSTVVLRTKGNVIIHENAFINCTSLINITIQAQSVKLSPKAFEGCSAELLSRVELFSRGV